MTDTTPKFENTFNQYVCEGDSIALSINGFDITATICKDDCVSIDDDDSHNVDQAVTGCDDKQQRELLKTRRAFENGEWFYCGVTIAIHSFGCELINTGLWGIEANYPSSKNSYLTEVANQLLEENFERARIELKSLASKLNNV